jgi:hypothetical protein
VHSANGNSIEGIAMVDSGSNKSHIRKECSESSVWFKNACVKIKMRI